MTLPRKSPIPYYKQMLVESQASNNVHGFFNALFGIISTAVGGMYDHVTLTNNWDINIIYILKSYGILDIVKTYVLILSKIKTICL